MSRRRRAVKRLINPDVKHNDVTVAKFINMLMKWGQKSVAERIVYQALDKGSLTTKVPHAEFLDKSLNAIRPLLELKSKRIGGANYQIPVEVSYEQGILLAIRRLIKHSRKRNEKTMIDRLAAEMVDSLANRGGAVKERENIHKMAEANKAFAHLRFV